MVLSNDRSRLEADMQTGLLHRKLGLEQGAQLWYEDLKSENIRFEPTFVAASS
jgi:hypothetical protein